MSFTSTEINDITSNPETIEFLPDGTLKNVVLEVVNLNKRHLWKKVTISSKFKTHLTIKGGSQKG